MLVKQVEDGSAQAGNGFRIGGQLDYESESSGLARVVHTVPFFHVLVDIGTNDAAIGWA